ncbi:FxSxx-COOH system tetratricopeptide repeat protein [Actinoplanes rectilineatus]|uniref:FxSxx-COOH system tetratricopeptide repeat protein n=1 Tax=Actinoplanes rectilineatus TaxID=113571 RepID=UPI0005F2C6D4|nr:FxSxx-COOH system tetratricopeptide repeat protein [Actinoplanes rectilineatus]
MTAEPTGKIVTFYSFKGGTGRTMALANVAWILAANGRRVLAVDWDLESPGLHRYFSPFLSREEIEHSRGIIGMIQNFQNAMARHDSRTPDVDVAAYARLEGQVLPLTWDSFGAGGRLDLLSAGKISKDYATVLAGLNWDDFYEKHAGGLFLDALRAEMKQQYDYVLIDSRTGYSDVADVCTIHLPDVLVDCFTLNEQGIEGAATVARQVEDHRRNIRILPVPMRLDAAERTKMDAGRAFAKQRFEGLPAAPDQETRDRYWERVFVPYQAYYNFEERLATFGDQPGSQNTMLAAYETLTAELTDHAVTTFPRLDPELRVQINDQFERRLTVAETSVALRYAAGDRVWAEWITHVLEQAGVQVSDPVADPATDTTGIRDLLIVSNRSEADPDLRLTAANQIRPTALAVCLTEAIRAPQLTGRRAIFLAGLGEETAVRAVLRLVGRPDSLSAEPYTGSRYPADEPYVSNLEARNQRFTGREDDLVNLRRQLRVNRSAVLAGTATVALQGMGGIGKTQIALEYAHRYRTAYDVVWWVTAEPVTFVDSQLADLAPRLRLPTVTTSPAMENARTVLDALVRGTPYKRWLLVYDNAEDPDRLTQFLPQGGSGHVLITSRTPAWGGQATTVPVDVFAREESIEHFRNRVATISRAEANQLADLLGDLPIAVAAAAALLADAEYTVPYLVDAIERSGPHSIPLPGQQAPEEVRAQSVQAVWEASLTRLQDRSPAAYRLLQLCAMMDTSIALDFIYSDELTEALIPVDSTLRERMVRGRLVQELNRLALVRTDRQPGERGGRITVHRVVQTVVQSKMTAEELKETRHHVHLALARFRPGGEVDDPGTWSTFRMLWPHLELSQAVECRDESVRQLLIDRVRYLWQVGDLNRGRERARRTEQVWQTRLKELEAVTPVDEQEIASRRRQLLHLQFNKANLVRSLGDFRESRSIDEAVLAEQEALLGRDHPLTLATASSLGGDLRSLGQYQEALERDKETYAAWQDVFGEDHPRTLASLNNLATSYRLIGDYTEALKLDERAARGRRTVLGDRHPSTLQSMGHIGRDRREGGDYHGSVIILRDVARMFAEELGEESREALNANANLAISLRSVGRESEAKDLLDNAYGLLSESFPTAPDTLACRLSRAVTLLGTADEQAHEELVQVHEAFKTDLGPKHPHTVVCVNDLAMALLATGSVEVARALAEDAVRDFATVTGQDHPYVVAAETNLAVCVAESGQPARAVEILLRASRRAARVLGESHPDTLSIYANLALLEDEPPGRNGRLTSLLERLSALLGESHPTLTVLKQGRLLRRVIDPLPF